MKKLISIAIVLMSILPLYSQENFKWDIVTEVPGLSKNELYSITKMFIAKTWKSANNVIQNDDKDAGQILVKGNKVIEHNIFINTHTCGFTYTISFMFKDGKSRILIENVFCIQHSVSNGGSARSVEWAHMPVMDAYPISKGKKLTGISEKNYLEIMYILKRELQFVVDSYKTTLATPIKSDDW